MHIYKCDVCGKEVPKKRMFLAYARPYYGNESEYQFADICDICFGSVFKFREENISGKESTK